ncbi:hypothetical protein EMCRGX_G033983 [Ephydatia muelleri]|eukprot:Em0022g267a
MAVSSMLQLDPSFPNHSHFSTQTISVKPAIHRGDPIPAYATGPEHERASLPLFCIAPENDSKRFELYEVLEQVYSAVWSGRTRVSNYTFLHLDQRTKRWLYQTAFEVLNHRPVVEEVLNESGFYAKNFDLHSHEALVHVITYDFLKSKFAIRLPPPSSSGKVPPLVLRCADALRKHSVKLNATVARMRVKADARTLTELLPRDARERYLRALHHPHYARVNMAKVASVSSEVIARLTADKFSQVHSIGQLASTTRAFFHGWKDLVAFSPDCRGEMDQHPLVHSGQLILQDRSSYHVVERLVVILDTCPAPAHVILTNPGIEALHIASSLKESGAVSVYGLDSATADVFQQRATLLGLNNIQLHQTPFSTLLPTDSTANTATLIVCLPPTTLPTVTNPVDFVLQEGGHLISSLLPAHKGAGSFCEEHAEILAHALEFVGVQYLVYVARSVHSSESEAMIRTVLEKHETSQRRHVCPTAQQDQEGLEHYLAILEKAPAGPLPTPSEVIARAIAAGILSADGLSNVEKKKKKKKSKVLTSSDGIPMTIAARKKVVQRKPPDVHVRPFRH